MQTRRSKTRSTRTCVISKNTGVRPPMKLTTVDRERITDSMLKIQSVRATLNEVDGSKIPHAHEVESCLETADTSLKSQTGLFRQGSGERLTISPGFI